MVVILRAKEEETKKEKNILNKKKYIETFV